MSVQGGQLLIELPTVLKGAVLISVNNRQEEVFIRLLKDVKQNEGIEEYRYTVAFLEEWHKVHRKHSFMYDSGCGCEYCVKTREYANLKLLVHRIRRKIDDIWAIYPPASFNVELTYLHKLERKLIELTEERKTMRNHLGFISKRVLKDI